MVSVYHNAGLKVFVDVVYNHTGEGYAYHSGDASTFNIISWRGFIIPLTICSRPIISFLTTIPGSAVTTTSRTRLHRTSLWIRWRIGMTCWE